MRIFYGFPYDKKSGKKLRNTECIYVIGIMLEIFFFNYKSKVDTFIFIFAVEETEAWKS